jgi:uncharacterized membrane protein YdjX (TVP38/TMEM64 family)
MNARKALELRPEKGSATAVGIPVLQGGEDVNDPREAPASAGAPKLSGTAGSGDRSRTDGAPNRSWTSNAWKAGVALLMVVVIMLAREGTQVLPGALEWVRGLGPWAAVVFIALYATATVAWVPGSLLTLASGAIFGLGRGTLFTLVGATLGASLAFLISRYVARSALERRIGSDRRMAVMDEAIGREGGKLVFLLRLSPAFPFSVMNYALGLTAVRFRDYVLASATGMVPGTFMYV